MQSIKVSFLGTDQGGREWIVVKKSMEDIEKTYEQSISSEEHLKICTVSLVIREILN